MRGDPAEPFIVSRWVRGEHFYGRDAHIADILDGPRDCLWLLGTRRIGKTSLLRQIQLLAECSPERGDLPLYWSLQGADSLAALSLAFSRGLHEAGLGRLDLRAPGAEDLFASIGRLRRHLRSRHRRLLLLCDDADVLVSLRLEDPALLRKLGRTLQSGEGMRTVLASTIRLWALAERKGDGSPFLHGFIPPLYLRALSDDEARSLIAQARLPPEARRAIDAATVERIREASGGHPYLLQMLSERTLQLGGVEEASRLVGADSALSTLFSSDLDSLAGADRAVLEALAEPAAADPDRLQSRLALDAGTVKASLLRLEDLGLVRRDQPHGLRLASPLLRRWLATRVQRRPGGRAAAGASGAGAGSGPLDRPAGSSPEELFQEVYGPLRELARRYFRRERPEHTLQPTALVHEAYLKLVDQSRVEWKGRTHFFAVGAKVMRRILIDHARSHRRAKRGGDWLRVTLSGLPGSPLGGDLDPSRLLALHAALEKLARIDERQARVVELRFFAGLTMSEVAEVLGVSKRTADGDWARARAWLEQELSGQAGAAR